MTNGEDIDRLQAEIARLKASRDLLNDHVYSHTVQNTKLQAKIDELKDFIREAYFVGVFTDEPDLEEKAEVFI